MNVSRQIGWSNESNLLYQILKQLNRLSSIIFGLKPKYKVYTALLTQNGGDIPYYANDEILTIGASYQITNTDGDTVDFTNIGAPNNNLNTWFVATGEIANSWGATNSGNLYKNLGAPVVTVLENTIGNIWFTYEGPGDYVINSDNLFLLEKSWGIADAARDNNGIIQPVFIDRIAGGDNAIHIRVSGGDFNGDGILSNTPIEIRVYN